MKAPIYKKKKFGFGFRGFRNWQGGLSIWIVGTSIFSNKFGLPPLNLLSLTLWRDLTRVIWRAPRRTKVCLRRESNPVRLRHGRRAQKRAIKTACALTVRNLWNIFNFRALTYFPFLFLLGLTGSCARMTTCLCAARNC
jgi:hypothetical protein